MTDVFAVLRAWLPDNADPIRPPMTLATLDADGYPDARTVLLSALDDHGVQFHTDARSRKAAELAAAPRACVVIPIGERDRQITLVGDVEPLGPDALREAYRRRTRYLQVLAWVNSDELAARPAGQRHQAWQAFEDTNPGPLEPPATWTGFRLRPHRVTFWTADELGPSTRLEYRRSGDGWTTHALAG
ncbi:pyridoxamine 5'-phosphate oxidase family protein [Cryptosporangium phraense]|uniref:Pyridoxine 5'-phosphate oxidase n=1 Tax=Cryptosporangium phraense TaxID=2593070 RepID=A0A545ANF2_9ACTN|nr:pyridoxamine 5'-phosphate oxidase family protein [Cryptosporangium phraense]TQS42868.1 pyridoxine 5'-phosphate oxidase [Cryptosporangium phraense]